MVDPRQTSLFDPFGPVLNDRARQRLLNDWPGVFRHVILEQMPVEALGKHFHPRLGRPTQELYSMAGLILLMEFHHWTLRQAVEAYCYHLEVQYALNLAPVAQNLSERSLERYVQIFAEKELAQKVMDDVTVCLAQALDLDLHQQRLDSTHFKSNMAEFSRTRLMGVALQRFLTQVQRHDRAAYDALEPALRQRYAPSVGRMFADTAKDQESRRVLRQQVAEDIHRVLHQFADQPDHAHRSSYQALARIFREQCEVQQEKIVLKAQTGNAVRQNPSDPDAGYNGHKGQGYQVQITETCAPDNEAQLITCALPQTAATPDEESLTPVLQNLQASGLLPEELLADTLYLRDENVQQAESLGVELIGPVPGAAPARRPNDLTLDDFVIDEKTECVTCCPDGQVPARSVPNPATGKTRTTMPVAACAQCAFRDQCPVVETPAGYQLEHTAQQRRVAGRRREQETEVFRERYRRRNGIESTNSALKRRLGLGRLRVRGRARVFQAIYLKITGWNILRAAVCAQMRRWVHAKAQTAVFRLAAWVGTALPACRNASWGRDIVRTVFPGSFSPSPGRARAA
jgi:hypothetical protein